MRTETGTRKTDKKRVFISIVIHHNNNDRKNSAAPERRQAVNEIRVMIEASGLRQVYIARKLGLKPDTVRKKIYGIRRWKRSEIEKLADLLRTPAEDLIKAAGEHGIR